MKNILFTLVSCVLALVCAPNIAYATEAATTQQKAEKMSRSNDTVYSPEYTAATLRDKDAEPDTWAWIKANWGKIVMLLLGVWEVVTRVFPTTSDWSWVNRVLALLKWLADLIPNIKAGGGYH